MLNPLQDNLSGGLFFRLSDEISDVFKYFDSYMFALHTGTDRVLTAFVI